MDIKQEIHNLLQEIGPGRMMHTAYDTAWVARLHELDEQMGKHALDWLRTHQLADGSWGAKSPMHYHDRLICTLAAMIALARHAETQDHVRIRRARSAVEMLILGLETDPSGKTAGFEMLVPTLLTEAQDLNILYPNGTHLLSQLSHNRAAKLAALPENTVNRSVTAAFSAEMAGTDNLHLLDTNNLQEPNGSVGYSPSATAYFALNVHRQDLAALKYLRQVTVNGTAPNVAPFDVFEPVWTLWNLTLTGDLDDDTMALYQPHLDFLQNSWDPQRGVAFTAGYVPNDGDCTSLAYQVLTRFDRPANLEAIFYYEEETHYRCYDFESNPSVSANIHILDTLRKEGLARQHPSVRKALDFLRRSQISRTLWQGKWHASPYYPTAHAIIAGVGYMDELIGNAVGWILKMQNPDGSWGYYAPTAEETAYCLQALVIARRHKFRIPGSVLERGAAWLARHTEPPYSPLWIGKCLYCPELVVRSAILSALTLLSQEGIEPPL
jgi:halimadienyl-diphosphate synthase